MPNPRQSNASIAPIFSATPKPCHIILLPSKTWNFTPGFGIYAFQIATELTRSCPLHI